MKSFSVEKVENAWLEHKFKLSWFRFIRFYENNKSIHTEYDIDIRSGLLIISRCILKYIYTLVKVFKSGILLACDLSTFLAILKDECSNHQYRLNCSWIDVIIRWWSDDLWFEDRLNPTYFETIIICTSLLSPLNLTHSK